MDRRREAIASVQRQRRTRRSNHALRRALALGSVPVALASVAFTPQSSAAVGPDPFACTFATLSVQPKVVLSVPHRLFAAHVDTDCNADLNPPDYRWRAFATNATPQDDVVFAQFDAVPIGSIVDFAEVSDTDHLGVWTWRPLSAHAPLTTASLNTTTSDVRLGAVAYTSAARRGTKVTVTARAYHYWTSTHAFGPWSGVRGTIEYAVPGQPWRPLKYAYPSSTGRYTYTYTTSQHRSYRVVMPDQQYVWGAVSAATSST